MHIAFDVKPYGFSLNLTKLYSNCLYDGCVTIITNLNIKNFPYVKDDKHQNLN